MLNLIIKGTTMNHDISHCDSIIDESHTCPKRETCLRYIAHLDLLDHPMYRRAYLDAFSCTSDFISISGHLYSKEPFSEYVHLDVK